MSWDMSLKIYVMIYIISIYHYVYVIAYVMSVCHESICHWICHERVSWEHMSCACVIILCVICHDGICHAHMSLFYALYVMTAYVMRLCHYFMCYMSSAYIIYVRNVSMSSTYVINYLIKYVIRYIMKIDHWMHHWIRHYLYIIWYEGGEKYPVHLVTFVIFEILDRWRVWELMWKYNQIVLLRKVNLKFWVNS